MSSFLKMVLAVILAQVILVGILAIGLAGQFQSKVKVPKGAVLVQTLDGAIPESPAFGALPLPFGEGGETHTSILENLEKARYDDRIKAVVLRVGSPAIGFAKLDELRERIAQLRAAGKPVWAYTEALYGSGLYLAGACDSLFLMPNGYVELHGVGSGRQFFKGTLEKLGIKQNIHRIEGYKSAAEMIQRDDMSEESRANVEWILDEVYPHRIETIEHERRLEPGTLEARVFPEGTLEPAEALAFGIVDRLTYWDAVESRLLGVTGVQADDKQKDGLNPRPRVISGGDYAGISRKDAGIKAKQQIAIVHATGFIGGEESGFMFPWGTSMGSATMEQAFDDAAKNKKVKAIIFRVDSGGGESSTSWKIQRAAVRAAEKKPLVTSMLDMAGSGGYLICYPCAPIIAGPRSIVGSIGSISGKFNMRGLYDKLGITMDFVTRGPNGLLNSDYFDYTPEQWESFKTRHWRNYEDWVDDIARFRHKTSAEIDSVGRGRVWTGAQALERGLIDELGTFDDAVRIAKEKAGIPADQAVEFVHYPKPKGMLESLKSGGLAAALHTLFLQLDKFLAPMERERTWAVDWSSYQ
jgi:protease IV